MPLKEYEAKRHLGITPEPSGGQPTPEGSPGRFVVQQHHATAMHWDFRLELDGVLLSWAVPKGPSLDTRDKRLAVHVEDHPLDYADFEGVIPKGEYGGGNVIVWDKGTWTPITDPHAGLKKGDFKFRLDGEKLVGGWVLVRLKPREGEKRDNWLLIKEKDEFVRPRDEYDIVAERPESVVSGLGVEEVSEQSKTSAAASASSAAQPVEGSLTVPPVLALCTLVTTSPPGDDWIGEVKYDGFRLTATLDAGEVRCLSRNAKDYNAKVPHIVRAVAELPAESAQLDGEIVVFDEAGISRFGLLQEALSADPNRIVFVVFDLLYLNGYDVRGLPTAGRKDLLRSLLEDLDDDSPIRFAEYVDGGVPALMEVACAQGLEGVVAKRLDTGYPVGRTKSWLKIKCRKSQELVVGGFTEPTGSRKGFGALLLGYYEGERLVYAGRVGSGFGDKLIDEVHARLKSLEATESPFSSKPKIASPHWVEPRLVAQVAFAEWTSDGLLRQSSFLGLRDDVDPTSVTREVPADAAAAMEPEAVGGSSDDDKPSRAKAGRRKKAQKPATQADDTVAGVRISNPGKALFPESGLTKLELARYYESVADLMLREVGNRPLTLVRCPVGNGRGKCFYQRHPDRGLSENVKFVDHTIGKHTESEEWLYVDDVAGLVALAQMGVAEIHTWSSRVDAPERPDRLVFDLDPGPDITWADIVTRALTVRDECQSLGFTPFVKLTGSKGAHIVLPIEPVWDFSRTYALSRKIAEKIAADDPDRFTSKMSKSLRPGRIFVDYVRNSETASAVGPYSTRFLPGPSVALPVEWDELDPRRDIRAEFTLPRAIERIDEGIDPWRTLDESAVGTRALKAAEKTLGIE